MNSAPLLGALAGYAIIMLTNPVRASLRDGLRVLRRYPQLWFTLGIFGFGYALFQLWLRVYFSLVLPPEGRPTFSWMRDSLWQFPDHALHESVAASLLPTLDSIAGLFNNLVSTFPISALAAFLLLINWEGHQRVLIRALRKRFGPWGWLAHAGILFCAVAAMAKPFAYLLARHLDGHLWLQWSPVLVSIAFFFEYLFGVGVQVYLILHAWCWVRGISVRHHQLLDFAIRRLSYVLRWALVVLVLSGIFVEIPLILQNFEAFAGWFSSEPEKIDARLTLARCVLDVVFLLFASVQITLTLHSESLGRALRDHLRFLRKGVWPFAWLLIVAALHFFLLHTLDALLSRGVGEGTALWVLWRLAFPWAAGWVGAWLLASWVCIFQRCEPRRSRAAESIGF